MPPEFAYCTFSSLHGMVLMTKATRKNLVRRKATLTVSTFQLYCCDWLFRKKQQFHNNSWPVKKPNNRLLATGAKTTLAVAKTSYFASTVQFCQNKNIFAVQNLSTHWQINCFLSVMTNCCSDWFVTNMTNFSSSVAYVVAQLKQADTFLPDAPKGTNLKTGFWKESKSNKNHRKCYNSCSNDDASLLA